MANEQTQQRCEVPKHGIISRPIEVLNSLPIRYRWEYTRRHPYYLLFWEQAHKHWQNPAKVGAEKLLGEAAILMLQLIGVVSDPPFPGTKFDALDIEPLSNAWREGAISAMTFRGLAGAMLGELPPESRAAIGNFLVKSASGEADGAPPGYKALSEFVALNDPSLDRSPAAAIIGVNVHAPLRTILQAVELKVKEWKTQLKITEHRRRDDKLPDYLRVWDLCEGWTGEDYGRRNEKALCEVAHELRESLSTVANRYRAAFRYIVGHEYRPDLWAHLFGVFKTAEIISSQGAQAIPAASLEIAQEAEVPETVVAPPRPTDHRGSFLENMGIVQDMQQSAELIMDVQTLLEEGYDSQRIAEKLEVTEPEARDVIEYLRLRHDEGI